MTANYTKTEIIAINDAWRAINEICTRTNWGDGPAWRAAEKLERQQVADGVSPPSAAARAMICKGWLEGLENPDVPARSLYWIRPGYLAALMLGVRHAVERRGDDYTGPKVEEAAQLCRIARAATGTHTARIVEGW